MSAIRDAIAAFLPSDEFRPIAIFLDRISDDFAGTVKRAHGRPSDEPVYFIEDQTALFGDMPNSLLLTEAGLSRRRNNKTVLFASWEQITEVALRNEAIHLEIYDGACPSAVMPVDAFGLATNPDDPLNFDRDRFEEKYQSIIPQMLDKAMQTTWSPALLTVRQAREILGLPLKGPYALTPGSMPSTRSDVPPTPRVEQAITLLNSAISSGIEHWLLFEEAARWALLVGDGEASLRLVRQAIHLLSRGQDSGVLDEDRKEEVIRRLRHCEGRALKQIGDSSEAIWTLRGLLETSERADEDEIRKDLDEALNLFRQQFPETEAKDRRFITFVDALPDERPEYLVPIPRAFRPQIKLPPGHPQAGEVYVLHPYQSDVYLSLADYETHLFQDRLHELCYLLQCLGAEEITVACLDSKEAESLEQIEAAMGVDFGISDPRSTGARALNPTGSHDLEIGLGEGSGHSNTTHEVDRKAMRIRQTFSPHQPAFVPDGLIWFPHELSWQRLAEQRLQGNVLRSSMELSTADVTTVSNFEHERIHGELNLLFLKLGANHASQSKTRAHQSRKTHWRIDVRFRDQATATPTATSQEAIPFQDAEDEYLDILKECLTPGAPVDETARALLNRWQRHLGLDTARAATIEATFHDRYRLAPSEAEYLEELRICLKDKDGLSSTERRLLRRVARQLSISEERELELQELV